MFKINVYAYNNIVNKCTVKPVLRGHPWAKKKWYFKIGDLLKEVQLI